MPKSHSPSPSETPEIAILILHLKVEGKNEVMDESLSFAKINAMSI